MPGQNGTRGMGGMLSTALAKLVKAGTITSAQRTAIVAALSAAGPQGGAAGTAPAGGVTPATASPASRLGVRRRGEAPSQRLQQHLHSPGA